MPRPPSALERLIKKSHKSYRLDLKFPIIFGVAEILRGDRTLEKDSKPSWDCHCALNLLVPVSDAQANRRRPLIVVSDYEIGDSDEDDRDIDFADSSLDFVNLSSRYLQSSMCFFYIRRHPLGSDINFRLLEV